MKPPRDPRTLIGLLECVDGTAAVVGKPHTLVETERGEFQFSNAYRSVLLTREAGVALYELLGEWLDKDEDDAYLDTPPDRNAEALGGLKDLGD